MRELAAQKCGGCAAVAYMERNLLMESVKTPRHLLHVITERVLR